MGHQLLDEIRQLRPFVHPGAEALVSIIRTATVLEHAQDEVLRPHGLTRTQYNVLRVLKSAPGAGLCGREIGERLMSKVPDVSRLLDRMEEMGLLTRKRSTADRRHVAARLTGEGEKLLDAATPALDEWAQQRFSGLTQAQLTSLVETLARVRASS